MKTAFAVIGILLVLGAKLFALVSWFMSVIVLPEVGYDSDEARVMQLISNGAWLFDILLMGLGIVLIGVAAMLSGTPKGQSSGKATM
jgi:hypothetical protein